MKQICLTDHFLIAMPSLEDTHFSRTVTYICQHNAEGAMGLIINMPLEITLHDLFSNMEQVEKMDIIPASSNDIRIMAGGPVQQERGFVLHTPEREWSSTLVISSETALTTSRDILLDIATGNGPQHASIMLGYAGWGAGQLEAEMRQNAWLSVPANAEILYTTPSEDKWQAAAALIGIDLNLLSPGAGHA